MPTDSRMPTEFNEYPVFMPTVARRPRYVDVLFCLVLGLVLAGPLSAELGAEVLEPLAPIEVRGELRGDKDISGVGRLGDDLLVVVDDEGTSIQILRRTAPDVFEILRTVPLLDDDEKEADFEAIAIDGSRVYVLASHSARRKQAKSDNSREENRKRFFKITAEPNRDRLARLELDGEGQVVAPVKVLSLRDLLGGNELLAPFQALPGKENGIDLEGLGVMDGHLFLGFRGPVLRDNLVPILRLDFDRPQEAKLLFVDLEGRGVRGMTEVADGLLLLAGPVGDGEVSYDVYAWDGRDCLPGDDAPPCALARLGTLGGLPDPDAKAEGIALLEETASGYEVVVVFDSARNGAPQRYLIPKKASGQAKHDDP